MKMKTLDDLVIGRNGLWFTLDEVIKSFQCGESLFVHGSSPVEFGFRLSGTVISKEQFQQRVKELGFVGRYRWGVEYKTDGKRPELADDVVVDIRINNDFHENGWRSLRGHATYSVDAILWDEEVTAFKITDQRYKPQDTSYLDKPEGSLDNGADWYDYDNQKALRLPPVGEKVMLKHKQTEQGIAELISCKGNEIVWWNVNGCRFQHDREKHYEFKPLDFDRKAKAERKRVVDAAANVIRSKIIGDVGGNPDEGKCQELADALYDANLLRLPESKK
jgi:hypothetical protein